MCHAFNYFVLHVVYGRGFRTLSLSDACGKHLKRHFSFKKKKGLRVKKMSDWLNIQLALSYKGLILFLKEHFVLFCFCLAFSKNFRKI